jgi:tRNA-splicing ligase RtcB
MELKEVEKSVWLMEKEGSMKVPAFVIANNNLKAGMQKDKTMEQLRNVASLEGIIKQASLMPDGHQGYGFPIGGVAAFDAEDGLVSPGGVGYDINCLPAGTSITDEFGSSRPIETFWIDNELQSNGGTVLIGLRKTRLKSIGQSGMTNAKAPYLMKREEKQGLYCLESSLGKKIRCTGDHPILTKNGMKLAKDISTDDEIGVVLFEGVEYEEPSDTIIYTGEDLNDNEKSELYKRGLLPLAENDPAIPRLARIIGYLIGDGIVYESIGKGYTCAYGKKEDLEVMKSDFELIGYSASIYKRERKGKIETQYGKKEFSSESYELHVKSNSLAKLLFALGMPKGKKTLASFGVPSWISNSKRWIKRLFLAGFFGAEMSTPSTLSKTAFYMAVVGQNRNEGALESGRLFLLQISEMLKEFGIECKKISCREEFKNKQGKTCRLRLMIAGEDNLERLWKRIGFEYNKKRTEYAEIACNYITKKRQATQARSELSDKVKEYRKKGFKLKELQEMFAGPIANARFIERAYYENRKQRISQSFESFEDFKKKKLDEINIFGVIFDKIEKKSFERFEGEVYDFNVDEYHNFIANNFIVSNCGVRLLKTDLTADTVRPKIRELCDKLFKNVPSGVGSESKIRISHDELDEAVEKGVDWAIEKGYGNKNDKENCEEYGRIAGADPSKVSPTAKKRGKSQFGTLGAGNHFLEIQVIDKIYEPEVAEAFGLKEGMITTMIHCGSRGFGHQICSDSIPRLLDLARKQNLWLPDQELVYAPMQSQEAKDYMDSMRCAVNFAFTNRHIIGHWVRETFDEVFGSGNSDKMDLLYDVAHNIAKFEEHEVDGEKRKLVVHRKGATRAFPAGRPELPEKYRSIGQPVLIPGSMGTASYVLVGRPKGLEVSWGSTCHGAGRTMSRHEAIRTHRGDELTKQLWEKNNIYVRATKPKVVAEEAPDAYKNVDDVVQSVQEAGISDVVVRLRPIGVVKG